MVSLIGRQDLDSARRKLRRYSLALVFLCALMLLAFLLACLLTKTGNASRMFLAAWVSLLLMGWACIALFLCLLLPAKRRAEHLEALLSSAPESAEGRFFLTEEAFQIPRSVRVRKVRLEDGQNVRTLNLDEKLLPFAPADGTYVRVTAARRFITGIEALEGAAPSARPRPVPTAPRRKRRRALSVLFLPCLVWALLSVMLTGFVFSRLTDAPRDRKIVIFADMELQDAPLLAERLEAALPEAVRRVELHPFSYAMLNSQPLRGADLYILPAVRVSEYIGWFAPLPPELASAAAPELPEGIPVFDPASGLSLAGDFLLYETAAEVPCPCYLFFGASSPHLEDGLALAAARALLAP